MAKECRRTNEGGVTEHEWPEIRFDDKPVSGNEKQTEVVLCRKTWRCPSW